MKSQKVTKTSKYTQASPNDIIINDYQNLIGQTTTILPLSNPRDSKIVSKNSGDNSEKTKVTYAESVFYTVNQSSELLLKNAPTDLADDQHQSAAIDGGPSSGCHCCVQEEKHATMCRQKTRFLDDEDRHHHQATPPPPPPPQQNLLNRSFSSLPRLSGNIPADTQANYYHQHYSGGGGPRPATTYVHDQSQQHQQRILRDMKSASLRRVQSPEIINMHRGPKNNLFYDNDVHEDHHLHQQQQHYHHHHHHHQSCSSAFRQCDDLQFNDYTTSMKRERSGQFIGRNSIKSSQSHHHPFASHKRRPEGDGMDSSVMEDTGGILTEDDIMFGGQRHLSSDLIDECQCACDHVIYSPTVAYTGCLQDDRIFATPAPDVTRRMDSTTTLSSKPELPESPPYYRSTSASSSNSVSSRGGLDLTTKHWWIIATVLLLAAAVGVGVPIALKISSSASFEERLEFSIKLLQETPLIDGHNDLPWNIRKFLHNKLKNFKFDSDLKEVSPWSASAWSHTDLERLERGHVAAQFWAAYVPCDSQYKDAVQMTLEQIDVIRRLTDMYYPRLVLCTSAEDIKKSHDKHQICSLIGVEGGHSLAGSLAILRTLYHMGVRYLTLTSTCNTPWADGSHVDLPKRKPEHGGLTHFGKIVIKEMNRLGMIVDLSHVSIGTMKDALEESKAPVIFSHSSASALCNSTRNVPDDVLRKLALNGGVAMVNFYSLFLTCDNVSNIADAVAHINHIREVAGVDSVGIGAGYDGINFVPQRLEDVSSYPTLFAELIGTGKWTVEDLQKLAGLNFLRVMKKVEKIRDDFKKANVPPYEDVMPKPKGIINNCTSEKTNKN